MVPISHANYFLGELPPALHDALDEISQERIAAAGEAILYAGGPCPLLCQLRAGKVEYRMAARRGGAAVTATMGKGDWIGLAEAFNGLPAMADVVAVTAVELRMIPPRDFEALVLRHPVLAGRLLRLLSLSLAATYQQARDRETLPLKERLLRTLYMLAVSQGKAPHQQQGILIEMPQEELSRRLAAARQTLNRQLKALEREGLIRVNYGSVTVLGLHRLAERQLNPPHRAAEGWPDGS